MRRMISSKQAKVIEGSESLVNTIVIQGGKPGIMIDSGTKITINKNKCIAAGTENFTIATGVTQLADIGTVWSSGGPGGATQGTIKFDNDFQMVLANISGSDYYLQEAKGDAYCTEVLKPEVCDAVTPVGKQFKAFKLED